MARWLLVVLSAGNGLTNATSTIASLCGHPPGADGMAMTAAVH